MNFGRIFEITGIPGTPSLLTRVDLGADGPNQVALVMATMIAVVVARQRGHPLEVLGEAAVASISSVIGAISPSVR